MDWKEQVRKIMLPDVPNFKDDYPQYSLRDDWWNLQSFKFVIFHPKACKPILYGTTILTIIFLSIIIYTFRHNIIFIIILGIIFLKVCQLAYKILKRIKPTSSIYTMFLKESEDSWPILS